MKFFCHVHNDIELVKLYINSNQATKLGVDTATDLMYCVKCKDPLRIRFEKVATLRTQIYSRCGN